MAILSCKRGAGKGEEKTSGALLGDMGEHRKEFLDHVRLVASIQATTGQPCAT